MAIPHGADGQGRGLGQIQGQGRNGTDLSAVAPDISPEIPVALLVDLSSGQTLYARGEQRRFIPASITKVMTMYLAFELLEEGRIAPNQRVTISDEVAREWGGKGSTLFLEAGDVVTVDTLLRGISTVSANDGAIALAQAALGSTEAWVEAMNEQARELDMRDSHFGTPNGWPDEGQTYVSARDLVKLASAMIRRHPARYRQYIGHAEFEYNEIRQYNHDPLIGRVRGADGIKTGYTDQAGYGFLGSAMRNGRRLVMVIGGAPRGRMRNDAAIALIEWGFDSFQDVPLYQEGQRVGAIEVQGGSSGDVAVVAPHDLSVALPPGVERSAIRLSLRYHGPVIAPIAAGDTVADLQLTVRGLPTHHIPLVARDAVSEAGPVRRIWNAIAGIFS